MKNETKEAIRSCFFRMSIVFSRLDSIRKSKSIGNMKVIARDAKSQLIMAKQELEELARFD